MLQELPATVTLQSTEHNASGNLKFFMQEGKVHFHGESVDQTRRGLSVGPVHQV